MIYSFIYSPRSGTPAAAVYWFKAAMAKYPRQMERFLGGEYAKATRLYYALQGTLNISSSAKLTTRRIAACSSI